MSEEFSSTDQSSTGPLCLRFWTHMYGNGVGSLNVNVRGASSGDSKIWGLTGDAGNNWYMGQVPIAATENFRVGKNNLKKYFPITFVRLFLREWWEETSWGILPWMTSL